jgi:hypothetical protein
LTAEVSLGCPAAFIQEGQFFESSLIDLNCRSNQPGSGTLMLLFVAQKNIDTQVMRGPPPRADEGLEMETS